MKTGAIELPVLAAAREALLRALGSQLPLIAWTMDRDLRLLSLSGGVFPGAPRRAEELPGLSLEALEAEGLDPSVLPAHRLALAGEETVYRLEWNGRLYECALQPFGDGEHPDGVVGLALDRTERSRAEAALRASEERYRTLAQLSPVGLFRCDREGRFTYVNEQWTSLTGLRPEASRDRDWQAALHPLDREWVLASFRECLGADRPFEAEFRFRRPDGSVSWVLARALPEPAPAATGYIGTVTNITDRKDAEDLLAFRQKILSRAAKGMHPEMLFESMLMLLEIESNGGRGILWLHGPPDDPATVLSPSLPRDLPADLERFLRARPGKAGALPTASEYVPLTGFGRSDSAGLGDWLGLGGALFLPLQGHHPQARGWMALVYSSADPASEFERKLLESAAEIVVLVLERRRQEEIDRLNEELASQNRRILEASRMKTEFMAKMSHELRTPLNAIIGFSQLLLDQKTGALSPKQFDFLKDVLQSGMHLLRIINDLLDLAKIEAGKVEAKLEPVSVGEFASDVRDLLRPLAAQKNLAMAVRADLDPPEALLDPQRFRQILYNLLSNAIKFTPEDGGDVVVSFRWRDGTLEMEVRDQGIGMKPEDLSKLFQPFQQLETSLPVPVPGSGLGLAICKQLAELHRGRIEVQSELGRGSRFTVSFPEAWPGPPRNA